MAPFEVSFVQRALWGGVLVSLVCALVGTWVVLRGMAFLGDAMSHGMLPGVALAALLGGNLLLGAAASAGAMAVGVTALGRSSRLSQDTSIGLLFVGMLSLGVIIVSHSQSFAVDLTAFLFGDVLAVREQDLGYLAAALLVAAVVSVLGYRSFVALSFDSRKAHTLGLRPRLAQALLLGLVTLAIVASFHVVGTLLVFGLLVAPPAAAVLWARRIPVIMLGAAVLGTGATVTGLVVSWHWGTAAGATIAAVAVTLFFVAATAAVVRDRWRGNGISRKGKVAAAALAAVLLPGACGGEDPSPSEQPIPHGYVEGAEETAEPQYRLVLADADTGAVRVLDLTTEEIFETRRVEGVAGLRDDGRFAQLSRADGSVHVVDSGAWTVDHGDHVHYYRTEVSDVGAPREDHEAATVPPSVRCPEAHGPIETRRGAVFGCADGALLVTGDGDGAGTVRIPYPHPVADADRAREFSHRPGSATLAARAGERGVWLLDVTERRWTLVETGPAVAVNTVGAGGPLLTLTEDGVLHALDAETGTETARTALFSRPVRGDLEPPVIEVDTSRAYVNEAAAGVIHEIDYGDDLRVARTFEPGIKPTYMVETGR